MPHFKIGEVIESIQKKFPSDLEKRKEAIFPRVNSEPKNVVFTLMGDGLNRTGDDLQKELEELDPEWITDANVLATICNQDLFQIGCTVEEKLRIGKKMIRTWRSSNTGLSYGLPIACYSLKIAHDFGLSFYSILGSSHSRGKSKAPYNRVKIMETLREKEELRIIDLKRMINLHQENIRNHLLQLKKCGFVEFESANLEESGWCVWKWVNDEPRPDATTFHTFRKVADLLYKENMNKHQIQSRLMEEGLDLTVSTIENILTRLSKEGKIEPVEFSKVKKSRAELTELGKRFVEEWIDPVTLYLQDERVEVIESSVSRILRNPALKQNYIRRGLSLYKPHSRAEAQSLLERYMDFRRICEHTKRGVRPVEFAEYTNLHKSTASRHLKLFYEKCLATRERRGKAVFYKPREN